MQYGSDKVWVTSKSIYGSSESGKMIVVVYVDDLIYFSSSGKMKKNFENELKKKFPMKFKNLAQEFVAYQLEQSQRGIKIHQTKFCKKILKIFEMEDAIKSKTPMEHLEVIKSAGIKLSDPNLYQSITGSLLYLSVNTRCDISYAVHQLTKMMKATSASNLKTTNKF